MNNPIPIQWFSPDEECLYAEASTLGFPPGPPPNHIKVYHDRTNQDATFALKGTHPNGWEYVLTGYGEQINAENHLNGPSRWTPRRMVIWND